MKPLLVGEVNPLSQDPRLDLWPDPPGSAGGRLAAILGLRKRDYLRAFDRMNLCTGVWNLEVARVKVATVGPRPVILLGAKVCQAFDVDFRQFTSPRTDVYILPHPSGRCRAWNDPNAVFRARDLLRRFL